MSPDPGPPPSTSTTSRPIQGRPGADERTVLDTFTAAARRSLTLAVAEALAWAAAAAAVSPIASLLVLALVLAWRLRGSNRAAIVRTMERTHGDSRNLFVTADEMSRGVLSAKPAVRERVFAHASVESRRLNLRALLPILPLVRAASVASAAWLLVMTAAMWRQPIERLVGRAVPRSESGAAVRTAGLRVTVSLTPPAYTGQPSSSTVDPQELAAVEGTVASFTIDGSAARTTAEHESAVRNLERDASGRFQDRIELRKTGYYAIETDAGRRRVIPIVVTPDALPAVRVTAPGRDLVFPRADRRVDFDVRATDDFGVRTLALEYTTVSGSGEQFEFKEGQIPLALTKNSDRDWRGTATQSMAALGLQEGDVLVYRVVAADARPGDGTARSDAFFIEISTLAASAGDAFTVPDEETRYALSQQMLIVKTERLDRDRPSMSPAEFTEAALNLAVEQRMIRAEFVFMLGGEIEDEDVEAQRSSELQEGRLQNRGQGDLRAATVAMSQAEKFLTGTSTRDALTAERAAVAALQRAFARDRYILRALGSRTSLDPKRRLTGSVADAAGGHQVRPFAPSNRRAALLQDLLAGIAALIPDVRCVQAPSARGELVEPRAEARPSTGSGRAARLANCSASSPIALAREALRIDADSPGLRKAAADLQRIADTWQATSPDGRKAAIDAVSAAVAAEATHAMAAPALDSTFALPGLAGGFVDALRGGGSK